MCFRMSDCFRTWTSPPTSTIVPRLAGWNGEQSARPRGRAARSRRPSTAAELRRALAGRAVRRPAAARRRRARARSRSAGAADGRAIRRARSDHARRAPRRVPPHPGRLRKTVIIVTHDMGEAFALGRPHRRARRGPASSRATARTRIARVDRLRAVRARCSTPCRGAHASRDGADSLLGCRIAQSSRRCSAQHVLLVAISTLVAVAHRRAARHLRGAASAPGVADRRRREHRADHSEPRDVRLPAAGAALSAASARGRRSSC